MNFIRALKWSFLSEIATKLVQPVVFVILARILNPEDFGVMSAALMVMAFSQIFWEAGMGRALIQRQTDIQEAANAAFWINLVLAVFIAGLLFVSASPIAINFFHDDRITTVIQVMTLQVFLGALGSVQTALLEKEMGFKKLFWVRFTTVSLPGMASIPLAWHGMGYWALVVGTLVGQVSQVIMLWRMSPWRPNWTFHIPVAREIGRFGAWVGLSGFLAWCFVWMDSLIVGIYLGSHDLGLYRTGNHFSTMVFALLFGPITPVLYSHFSRMNGDRERIKKASEMVIKLSVIIAVPSAIIIYSISESIGNALFGEKWEGIGFVIGVMALVHGFAWIVGVSGWAYHAIGKPSYDTLLKGVILLIYIAGYLYSIHFGFDSFVWTRLALALLTVVLQLLVMKRVIGIKLTATNMYITFLTLGSFFIVLSISFLLDNYNLNAWVKLFSGGLASGLVIGGWIFYFERERMVRELIVMFKKMAS